MTQERMKRNHRHIVKRIIIRGTLILETPTCLGSGDTEGPVDLALLYDSISNHALLTGSSIAGALRNYLREYQRGYGADEEKKDLATVLFGGIRRNDDGDQSPLIVNDSISSSIPDVELRDGVSIDGKTGTARSGYKYDLELLAAGTEFPLCFELLIDEKEDEPKLLEALALALRGLEKREIGIGMKKRRGFGRCYVDQWEVWKFNMQNAVDRLAWLAFDRSWAAQYPKKPQTGKIWDILKPQSVQKDERDRLTLHATFKLDCSLLIRSGQASTDRSPDVVHLRSKRGNDMEPVLSGTSLAGVLRHRAERIVNTLEKPIEIINQLFGFVDDKNQSDSQFSQKKKGNAKASRLVVHETQITNTVDLVQSRIAIDRFTGGALHGALFDEQPVFGKDDTHIEIYLELREPKPHEIGLLLLLLKDLWTSDLPIGGGSSIGRGRLQGKKATIIHHASETVKEEWTITQNGEHLQISDAAALEKFVKELAKYLGKEKAA